MYPPCGINSIGRVLPAKVKAASSSLVFAQIKRFGASWQHMAMGKAGSANPYPQFKSGGAYVDNKTDTIRQLSFVQKVHISRLSGNP